jgi:hypothetical protein
MCRLQWFPVNYAQRTLCSANIHKCPRPAYFHFLHPSLHSLIRRHIHKPAHPHIKDQSANTFIHASVLSLTTPRDSLAHSKKKSTSESPPAKMYVFDSIFGRASDLRTGYMVAYHGGLVRVPSTNSAYRHCSWIWSKHSAMAKEKDGEESISCTVCTTSTSYSISEGHIEVNSDEDERDKEDEGSFACRVRDSLDVQRQVYDGEKAKRREKKGIKGWVRGAWYGVLEKWD